MLTAPSEEIYIRDEPIQVIEEIQALEGNFRAMKAIAHCESSDRHYNEDGTVLTGLIDPRDIGRYQINSYYHQETAENMGLDIFDEEDNEEYAVWLFEREGFQPWSASKLCLNKLGYEIN